MSRTLQVKTTILPGHRIEICAPDLPEGRSATVVVTLEDPKVDLDARPDPDLERAERLFMQDLPHLLESKSGRWVAYTAQGCIAEGNDPLALYRHCYHEGLQRGHFLVARVEGELPAAEISDNWFPPDA